MKTIKIGGIEYTFKDLKSGDRWRLRDITSNSSVDLTHQLISKSVTKNGLPIEIHEVALLDGRVAEKFSRWLTVPKLTSLDEGTLDVEAVKAGSDPSEVFELDGKHYSYNPDYTAGDYTRFLSASQKQLGTATANLIRARLLIDDKPIKPDELNALSYGEAIALENYLTLVFTDPTEPPTS